MAGESILLVPQFAHFGINTSYKLASAEDSPLFKNGY